MIVKHMKISEGESIVAILEIFSTSLLNAIKVAHEGVLHINTLLCRLDVLERRFKMLTMLETIDLDAPLSTDFSFLERLVGLGPASLARVLSSECFALFKVVTADDIRYKTRNSDRLAQWATDLSYYGEECIAAGLEKEVGKLCQVCDRSDRGAAIAYTYRIFGSWATIIPRELSKWHPTRVLTHTGKSVRG